MELREIQLNVVKGIMGSKSVRQLAEGNITKESYVNYLSDVYSYALHSSQVIAIAGARLVLSHPPLAQYLFTHAHEELGHDKWVATDLKELGLSDTQISSIEPSSPCLQMLALEYYFAHHDNPVGLFGWMFVLESLGGKVGGAIADQIDRALGLNGKALYFLKGHGEADQSHSEDLRRVISENILSSRDISSFKKMVTESARLYKEILDSAIV